MIKTQELQTELRQFEITICKQRVVTKATDEIEAVTLAIESLRKKGKNFDISFIIPVVDKSTNTCVYVLAEIALANAGLYREARIIGELFHKKSKKKIA